MFGCSAECVSAKQMRNLDPVVQFRPVNGETTGFLKDVLVTLLGARPQ